MANLKSYYGLCPIIDTKSLLGVFKGEKSNSVIVTLGKNMSVVYKLLDQRQLFSWRTKEKFTSSIIYDKELSCFLAAFNHTFIRMWTKDDNQIDKLKKYKFNEQIHTLINFHNKNFIIFKNGYILFLNEALNDRKDLVTKNLINKEQLITDVIYKYFNEEYYIGLIIDNSFLLWTKFKLNSKHDENFYRINLERNCLNLNGYVFHLFNEKVELFTLWSDNLIYKTSLIESFNESNGIGEIFTTIKAISCKYFVSMLSLDDNYIALYGNNSDEEGALLILYNIQFNVIQSRLSFKLFTNGARMWCIGNNLFLPVGRHLAVVPFDLTKEQLAELVGSHKLQELSYDCDIIFNEMIKGDWGYTDTTDNCISQTLKRHIDGFTKQGLSESFIIQGLLSNIIQQENINLLKKILYYFSDIPEHCIINILKFVLNYNNFENIDVDPSDSIPVEIQPLGRIILIDLLLSKEFCEVFLLLSLRTNIGLIETITLLEYIYYLLNEELYNLPNLNNVQCEKQLLKWITVILDANYQKILTSKDNRILFILKKLIKLLEERVMVQETFIEIVPLLIKAIHTKGSNENYGKRKNDNYYTEELIL